MKNTIAFAFYCGFTEMCCARGIRETVRYAAEQGFAAVEPLENTSGQTNTVRNVKEAEELRTILEDYGMSVACYSVGTNLYQAPDAVDALCRQIELAAAMGSPFLHHTIANGIHSTAPFPPTLDDMLPELVDSAFRVAELAKSYGVRCIYEDQGYYVNGTENFGKFFHAVRKDCPTVGICGDLGNISFVDETAVAFYTAFAPYIVHVHCKDYKIYDEEKAGCYKTKGGRYLENAIPGTGTVDYEACFRILRDAGYTGKYAMELEGFTANDEVLTDSNRAAMRYCRKIWENVRK